MVRYSILEAIAEIHGCTDKLKLIPPNADDVVAADTAEEIEEQKKSVLRLLRFRFVRFQSGPPLNTAIVQTKSQDLPAR